MSDEEEDMEVEEDSDFDDENGQMDDLDEDERQEESGEELFLEDPIRMTRSLSFECLTQETIYKNSMALIDDVMAVCGIPNVALATVLLRQFKWNKERLVDNYLENSEKTLREAGLSSLELERRLDSKEKMFSCLICLDDLPAADTYALSCGHRYCKTCWKGFLEVKIKDGPIAIYSKCPAPKCKCIVHEQAYKQLVSPAQFEKYNRFLMRSFVEDNTQIKWCPSPGCTNAIRSERTNRKLPVTCSCGFTYCFRCGDAAIGDHSPVGCDHLERWLQKANDESENVKWMIANTKKCPKCRSPIEKNGGCMHMTCKIAACGYEFCWLCRGAWTEHGTATGGYYQCNKYDISEAKKEDDKANDVKTELETYMFYFHRYESHRNAGKIADEQRKNCAKREEQILAKFDVRSQDTKFLSEATEQLIHNRRVLEYSYVMGFYLDKSKPAEKNLFEYLQEDLEKHTNTLSENYEQVLDSIQDYHAFMNGRKR